jgi:hypothetical protein
MLKQSAKSTEVLAAIKPNSETAHVESNLHDWHPNYKPELSNDRCVVYQ